MINDYYSPLPWLESFSVSDPFDSMFTTDGSIMEFMTSDEMPWNDHHRCSSFLHDLDQE